MKKRTMKGIAGLTLGRFLKEILRLWKMEKLVRQHGLSLLTVEREK